MDIKLIALDMDGTTLQKDYKSISQRTENALKDAIAKGIHVVPSTGRILGQLPESVIRIPGINYAVTSNGAAVMNLNTGEAISNNFIGTGSVRKIIQTLTRRGLFCEVYYKGDSYSDNRYLENVEKINDFSPDQVKFIKYKSNQVDNMLDFTFEHAAEIEKINIPLLSEQIHRNLWQKFSRIHGVMITQAVAGNIEVNHRSANKGDGLKQLCKILKLDPKNIMAIGDSDNDLQMIEFAGLGVAVGNASDDVKAIANRITLPFDQDGVAHAIEKYALS
ncbi:Cof-type HAD-IIB family hydrolase [Acetobacterium paludosum]|uniref:Cof-type HAD-IIB family hydrolase n=1 Tax=Acetobacterium paludosum TaxID=52693 RepID=A0A923HVE7_9FIRM|nr:Cof-type HAD-IIB family hydrolase [Acetobacterium paludosum]MBC3887304.1 Cof-type HAD-IIB family hydrolase [Acetobacterium paludosum]